MYSEPCQIWKMELFMKIVGGFWALTFLAKGSIVDDGLGSEYFSGVFLMFIPRNLTI